uniref:Legume lectin domain-containing protein n=1 Tax=Arundo donax TaxID=35708 RepID=A0A0A9EY13_ARUDO
MAAPRCSSHTPPLILSLLLLLASSSAASSSFSLHFFPGTGPGAIAQVALSGAANATPGAVSMASPSARVQYRNPIVLSFPSFSTYFSFALPPPPHSPAASLAFFLTPSPFSSPSLPALAVIFTARHIRVDLAGRTALQTQSQSQSPRKWNQRLHSWIDYNATSATLHVRLSTARLPNPPPALLSYPLDLSPLLRRGPMVAGFQFQASSGNCSLFSWAFRASHGAPYRMHSQPLNPADLLTTPPPERVRRAPDPHYYNPWGAAVSLLFAAACGAMVTFFVLFLWYSVAARRPVAPVEYPMHPSDVLLEKIVLVGAKDDAAAVDNDVPPSGGNK